MNDNNTIDFYVGIDFGAGETSASYFDLKSTQSNTHQEKLHRLSISSTGDIYTVYSALKQQVNGKWALVTDPTDLGGKEICIDFKKRVCDLTIDDRKTCIQFWGLVFDTLLENNDFLHFDRVTGARNFQLLTARPSGWSEKDENEYLALMREAGLPVDIIVKESDAALYKWEQYSRKGSVLIVDCGSSTIDLSMVKNGQSIKDELYSCEPIPGAQCVEALLYKHFQKDQSFNRACHEVTEYLVSKEIKLNLDKVLKLYLRSVKEHYYSFFPEQVCFSLRKRPFTNGPGDILDEYMTREQFEDIVAPYRQKVYLFFRNVSETLRKNGNSPDTIVLSGGASRMPFIKQTLEDVFELDGDKIFHDKNEADFVVSDGLALLLHQNPLYGFIGSDYIITRNNDYKYGINHRSGSIVLEQKFKCIHPIRNNGTVVVVEETVDENHPLREEFKKEVGREPECTKSGLFSIVKRNFLIEPFDGYIDDIEGTTYSIIEHHHWVEKEKVSSYSVIDENGTCVIPRGKFSAIKSITEFQSDYPTIQLLKAWINESVGLIDLSGNVVLPIDFDAINDIGSSFYLVPIKKDNLLGLVDLRDGHLVLPCRFIELSQYRNYNGKWRSYVYYKENGKGQYYIIDEKGERCSNVYDGLKLQLNSPIAQGLQGNEWVPFSLIPASEPRDMLREQRINDFKYCYTNGMSIFVRSNPKYPMDGYGVITFNDVIDYKFIIRSYHGPVKQLVYDENECDDVVKEYSSLEEMVDDGWQAQ